MPKFFDSESIVTSTSTPAVLDRDKLDSSSGARADRVLIQVKGAPIYVTFAGPAVPTAVNSFEYGVGDQIDIGGYDDLIQFKAVTVSGAGTLYVEYSNGQ